MTTFQGVPPGSFAFFTNRDGRLSTDKSPYKLWTRSTSETRALGGIAGYDLEVAAKGIVTGDGAEQSLETAPRGCSMDHPRIEHLR